MKREVIKETKLPSLTINPSLNKLDEQTMFAKKLEQANKMLETARLPPKKSRN